MELEGLQFKVEGLSGDSGAGEIRQLASALGQLKSSLPTEGRIKSVVGSLRQLVTATRSLKFDSTSISNLGKALQSVSGAKIPKSVGDNIRNIGEAARTITDADVARIRELSDALSGLKGVGNVQVKMSPGTSGGANATPQDDGTAPKSGGTTDMVSTTEEAADKIAQADSSARGFFSTLKSGITQSMMGLAGLGNKFLDLSQAIGTGMGKAAITGIGAGAKLVGFFSKDLVGSVKNATTSLGGLIAGLKRIAMYRAMRTVIKMITEGFTTGLKNVYEYSRLVGTQFASSMDQIATSSLYLKNSLGAMAAPLLQILAPAIDFVIDKFVALLNVINMFIARLTGSSVATVAKKTFTPWGDSASDAAGKTKKAVKEIRRTLLGFDEINRLDAPTGSNSGGNGGGGGGGADYGSMFEQVPIAQEISDFADRVKELFKQGKWEELGTFLGQKFNEIVNMIPWGELGTKVGKGINGVITTAYHFLKEADFQNLGAKFALFLNNALTEIDTEKLGRLLVRKFTALADLLIGAITHIDWGLVASKASDLVIGIFSEAAEWIQGIDWAELSQKLYDGLVDFLTHVKWAKIASKFMELLGSAFGAVLSVAGTLGVNILNAIAKGVKATADWVYDNVIAPIIEGFKTGDPLKGFKKAGTSILKAIGKGFTKFKEAIIDPFIKGVKKTFKISGTGAAKLTEIKDIGKSIITGIGKGILDLVGNGWQWLKGLLFGGDDTNDNKELASVGIGLEQSGWETVEGWFEGLGDKIDLPEPLKLAFELFKKGWESVKKWWSGLGADIKLPDPIQIGVQLFKDGWEGVTSWFNGHKEEEGSNGPSGHSTTTHIDVEPVITGYSTKEGVVAPWGSAHTNIVEYNTKQGVTSPWQNAKTTITEYFTKTGVAAPWGSAAVSIASYNTNSGVTAPWLGVTSSVSKYSDTNATKPWAGVTAGVSSYSDSSSKKPWAGVTSTVSNIISQVKAGKNPWDAVKAVINDWAESDKGKGERPWSGEKKVTIGNYGQTDNAKKKRPWASAKALISSWSQTNNAKNNRPWRDAAAKITEWDYNRPTFNGTLKITKLEGTSKAQEQIFGPAVGGVASGGHFRYSIPQYAAGGLPSHGTMFVAGEAGAEVVGHINGRTEVLNASQIASAIHAAVLSAMQQANAGQPPMLNVTVRTENNEVLARAVTRGQRSLDARLNPTAAY